MLPFVIITLVTAVSSEAVEVQGTTNTKLFSGNQALDSGTLGFGLGIGASVLGSALIGGAQNGCGRKKRDAQGTDQRFLLGRGSNCGNNYNTGNNYPSSNGNNYNYPSNNGNNYNYPSNNGNNYIYPSNNQGNNYNTGNYNNGNQGNNYNTGSYNSCSCTSLSISDHYGNVNGNCRR